MSHNEHCGCGCGCNHDNIQTNIFSTAPLMVTDKQKDFLHQLSHRQHMPTARFTIADSREKDFLITALAPVFINSTDDDIAMVKEVGAFLQELEDMELISIDYDVTIDGYDYKEYKESKIYEYFCDTVAQGATKPGFLGNTPVLELGSITITEAGKSIVTA